jgi:hypothetical protein
MATVRASKLTQIERSFREYASTHSSSTTTEASPTEAQRIPRHLDTPRPNYVEHVSAIRWYDQIIDSCSPRGTTEQVCTKTRRPKQPLSSAELAERHSAPTTVLRHLTCVKVKTTGNNRLRNPDDQPQTVLLYDGSRVAKNTRESTAKTTTLTHSLTHMSWPPTSTVAEEQSKSRVNQKSILFSSPRDISPGSPLILANPNTKRRTEETHE